MFVFNLLPLADDLILILQKGGDFKLRSKWQWCAIKLICLLEKYLIGLGKKI